jgi:hypothetical protein
VHRIYWTFCTAFAAAPSGTILRFALPEFGGNFRVTRALPFGPYVSTGHIFSDWFLSSSFLVSGQHSYHVPRA